jgi:hypothetical protein
VNIAGSYRTVNHGLAIAGRAGLTSRHKAGRKRRRAGLARPSCPLLRLVAAMACFGALCATATALPAGTEPAAKDKAASKIVSKIAFAGDSIVDNYWEGITRVIATNPCLKTNVELGRFARNGTGLARGDKLYWPREVRRIGDTFKPNLFVLSVGLNDRQFIVDGNGARTAYGAPNWNEKYREQIIEFLKGAAASKAGVLIVGLPAVRDNAENADLQEKNKLFAEAVAAVGASNVQYLEPWRLKPSGVDNFASYGPDHNGRMVQIRTADGEHFTVAGEDLVGAYLYPKIVTAFDQMGLRLDRACASADKGADSGPDKGADKKKEP